VFASPQGFVTRVTEGGGKVESRGVVRSLLAVSVAVILCGFGASAASANVVWAGPDPANGPTPCADVDAPCSLSDAVAAAQPGDTVELLPGDYDLDRAPLVVNQPSVSIMGAYVPYDPFVRPFLANGGSLELRGDGDYVSRIQMVGQLGVYAPHAVVEQVNVLGRGMDACHLVANGTMLRDSICNGEGADGVYAEGTGIQVRNVTAVGGYCGVNASGDRDGYDGANSVAIVNTIATLRDANAGTADICVSDIGHAVTAHAQSSMYSSVDEAESQTVLFTSDEDVSKVPSLLDLTGNDHPEFPDLHEAPWSFSVGAGRPDPLNGGVDVDGEPRVSSCGKTDVGADQLPDAYECSPPVMTTTTTTTTPPPLPPSVAPVIHPRVVSLLSAVSLVAHGTPQVHFTLAHAATVTGDLYVHGKRIGRAFQLRAHAGHRKVTIPQTVHGHALTPHQHYRLVMTATSPHAPAVTATVRFVARS
jgi:hypothetical protein